MKKTISSAPKIKSTMKIEASCVGIDLGDRTGRYCALDSDGQVLVKGSCVMTHEGIGKLAAVFHPVRMVIEAGTHSRWIEERLVAMGHSVIVANPRALPLISKSTKKNDAFDAETLARLGRVDPKLLSPIKHRSKQAQVDLQKLRSRKRLVETRQQLIGHVRGAVKSHGGRLRRCSTPAFHHRAPQDIPSEIWPALEPVITTIASLTKQIRDMERDLERLAEEHYPETMILRQIKGVGLLLSLHYILVLEDPSRFLKSRDAPAYVGLVPKLSESGEREPELPITKRGDRELRCLLVQSAHYILGPFGPDTDLRRWGLRLAEHGRKNAYKRAAIAVARKLAVLMHSLWKRGGIYIPLRADEDAAVA